jgi:alpha-galactosidase
MHFKRVTYLSPCQKGLFVLQAIAILLLLPPVLKAASNDAPIRYLPEAKIFIMETDHTSYVFGINEQNALQNLYWGKKISREDDFSQAHTAETRYPLESKEGMTNEEYAGWGGMRYTEPCLKVTMADGVRDLVLKYVSHQVKGDTLEVLTKDMNYDLFVTLTYQVFPHHDIIRKNTTIENRTKQPVVVESAQSGVWYVPPGVGYRLTYLSGRWAGENQVTQETIHQGKKVLESRRMVTSQQATPWFAIDYHGEANEEYGRVWFGALGWSGNWKIVVEQTPNQQVRVVGGFNDFDFSYQLKPGESLKTPEFYGGYTDQGFGKASRIMHHFELAEILPRRPMPRLRPVSSNSWCATEFAANEENQKQFAAVAAKLGVELLMMDDGWFGARGARKDDHAGLGDWYPDPDKFPNGLKPLIDYVHGLGMEFGLWIEPEMVNPDSNLYRQHPDWVINFPGRPRTQGRNQLMLNLAREDVKEWVFNTFDKLLTENDIKVVKWDMNRHISEPGWPEVPPVEQKEIWVKYVANLYGILDRLRAKHPSIEIESSQSGGGRVDLEFLKRIETMNSSDNGDSFDLQRIGEGYSFVYAPKVTDGSVEDNPRTNGRSTPLKFRFLQGISMGGGLELCCDIRKWPTADLDAAKEMIGYYKVIRRTLQEGDLYRLDSPGDVDISAKEYVAPDGKQAVIFAFRHSQQFLYQAPTIYLRGLDDRALYRLQPIDGKLSEKQRVLSGAYLMNHGLDFKLEGDFDSTSVLFEKVE